MKQTSGPARKPAEAVIKDIRRATRRQFSAEEKIRIVLDGLRGEDSIGADCAVSVDGNAYSVPWRLIGERVRVTVSGAMVRVHHGGREVAVHAALKGRHGRIVDDAHLAGLVGSRERPAHRLDPSPIMPPALLRPLAEYEAVAGGGF